MEKIHNLKDMLVYDIRELNAAEHQIVDAMPFFIDAAENIELKAALQDHFRLSEKHIHRLNEIYVLLGKGTVDNKHGVFSGLFGGAHKNRGIEGILEESEKKVSGDMDAKVKDAVIIGCVQKVEHFEICAYGTTRTFALQLGLIEVANLLQQTLEEEHEAGDQLTALAVAGLNQKAVDADASNF